MGENGHQNGHNADVNKRMLKSGRKVSAGPGGPKNGLEKCSKPRILGRNLRNSLRLLELQKLADGAGG